MKLVVFEAWKTDTMEMQHVIQPSTMEIHSKDWA
jgi:hypothetical protein